MLQVVLSGHGSNARPERAPTARPAGHALAPRGRPLMAGGAPRPGPLRPRPRPSPGGTSPFASVAPMTARSRARRAI